MKLETAFRWSTYLTLLLASASLGYSELPFLPWIMIYVAVFAVLLGVVFRMEDHWSLSVTSANITGLFIAALAVLWFTYHLLNIPQDLLEIAPRPALMLPYLGPLMMILLVASKLFHRKQVEQFWMLQAVGLVEVILACVLALEPLFGLLLLAYLVCALWSVSLFHLRQGIERSEEAFGSAEKERWMLDSLKRLGPFTPRRAFRWTILVSSLSLSLFLVTPQLGNSRWDLFNMGRGGVVSTGYADGIDLNRVGQVKMNESPAFRVHVRRSDGTPKRDLNKGQYWRGTLVNIYDHGKWDRSFAPAYHESEALADLRRRGLGNLKDLGSSQYFLTFVIDMRETRGLFLADPVISPLGSTIQVFTRENSDGIPPPLPYIPDKDGSTPYPGKGIHIYRQVTQPPLESGLSMPFLPQARHEEYLRQPVPGIRDWTGELLRKLRGSGELSADDMEFRGTGAAVPPRKWEKVSRTLSGHLALSKQFTYSLTLRRVDPRLDPTEDFLRNVRQGHCERYASALALMLRSCGIPSRVVLGFRGVEPMNPEGESDGLYVVRNSDAHSWVEALVSRPGPGGEPMLHWLTLDPTPSDEILAANQSLWSLDLDAMILVVDRLWKNFVVDYSAVYQKETARKLGKRLKSLAPDRDEEETKGTWSDSLSWKEAGRWLAWSVAALAFASPAGWWLLRWWRRRHPLEKSPTERTPFVFEYYRRVLVLLENHFRLTPGPTQTPREFVLAAEPTLRGHPQTGALADVPLVVVDMLYRVRYGLQPLNVDESFDVDRRVSELETALATEESRNSSFSH